MQQLPNGNESIPLGRQKVNMAMAASSRISQVASFFPLIKFYLIYLLNTKLNGVLGFWGAIRKLKRVICTLDFTMFAISAFYETR